MTHLPYIVASYGLTAGVALVLGIGAVIRLRRAQSRLATLEAGGRTRRHGKAEQGAKMERTA